MPDLTCDLVVNSPFADFTRGQRITDRALVEAILADERSTHVVKVAPLPPEAAADPASPAPAADPATGEAAGRKPGRAAEAAKADAPA